MWRSSKQPFPCLATAESELVEAIEGVIVGDSLACMIEELEGKSDKTLLCDSTAAVCLATQRVGCWRTRHLKVRAAHLRWRIENDWEMVHQNGKELVADLGTKVLGPIRFTELKELMSMERMPEPAMEKVMARELQRRMLRSMD